MRVLKVQGVFLKLAGSSGWQTEVFPKFYSWGLIQAQLKSNFGPTSKLNFSFSL
jgi:hypothetical protein